MPGRSFQLKWRDVDLSQGEVVSALVGIALGEGKLKGLDQTVRELLA